MKKLLRSIAFVLCACLCACVFVACDDTPSGDGDNSGSTRTWKEMLQSDDMKNVHIDITDKATMQGVTNESVSAYRRNGNKYMCKSQFTESGSGEKQTITEYFEHEGDKWYIYHTAPNDVKMKTELDEDGSYEFTYGEGAHSGNFSQSFMVVGIIERYMAKLVAVADDFDGGINSNGAKVYTFSGDLLDIYMAMAPDMDAPPAGLTMTGSIKISVKADKIVKTVFAATMKMNGQTMTEAEMTHNFKYDDVTVTLPEVDG